MAPCIDDGKSLFNFVVQEGNGVKGLVDSGLLNVPSQYVQPPNERIDKSNAYPHDQAPIDLSGLDGPRHGQVVEAIARAAETFGFFQVVNHGVPLELLESLKDSAHCFFGQAPEKKAVYLKGDYVSMVYTNDEDALKHWPNECKEVALEYLKTSTKMVKKIVQVLFEHLGVTVDEPRIDALIALKMVLSNGRFKSAEHRVRTTSTQSRVSIPIFTIPQPTEKIGPLPELMERDGVARYREFLFGDYMNNFFGKAHQGKKSLDFAQIAAHSCE
ncbi:2-oxoglutarate (2OG) and Fe(II)-dependent oxygenase superfamily protein [Actinidia rufa]|uniref:2-oxoglutarate (2OG) and Fe(II)-dependent oxygenase superfamily protein n=1 Tax=Actinidia rufa TaxID=165716 RepID=A0A7J0GP89_9ERIC|nr:2-oxoglutarate (2OG) and Fe(II)-dependent oxygenase superfamily protein [Actinidia rufa]